MPEGAMRIERVSDRGNRSVVAFFGSGKSSAEARACKPGLSLDVDAAATGDALVLFLDAECATTMHPTSCAFHMRLIRSPLGLVAKRAAPTRAGSNTFRSAPRARSCCRTYRYKLCSKARAASPSRSTAGSWPITHSSTAAPHTPSTRDTKGDNLVDFHKNRFEIARRSIP